MFGLEWDAPSGWQVVMVVNAIESTLAFAFYGWFFGRRWFHQRRPGQRFYCPWLPNVPYDD